MALRAVRGWLEPWIMLRRYWHGWSQLPHRLPCSPSSGGLNEDTPFPSTAQLDPRQQSTDKILLANETRSGMGVIPQKAHLAEVACQAYPWERYLLVGYSGEMDATLNCTFFLIRQQYHQRV